MSDGPRRRQSPAVPIVAVSSKSWFKKVVVQASRGFKPRVLDTLRLRDWTPDAHVTRIPLTVSSGSFVRSAMTRV